MKKNFMEILPASSWIFAFEYFKAFTNMPFIFHQNRHLDFFMVICWFNLWLLIYKAVLII